MCETSLFHPFPLSGLFREYYYHMSIKVWSVSQRRERHLQSRKSPLSSFFFFSPYSYLDPAENVVRRECQTKQGLLLSVINFLASGYEKLQCFSQVSNSSPGNCKLWGKIPWDPVV